MIDVSLQVEARRRYLNYALSVITSRALPDVRDGLKPVQRRILYAMLRNAHLRPDAKHRKSAAVVGEVLGKYHPHGDSSVYDAMVRMAQGWAMRAPLVDGSGNWGSLDGDEAAAMRYTECRLAPAAMGLLEELDAEVVDMRPNYDGTAEEPVVLPARFPNLLVNGSTGIAVGMATNIPPHNLREVVDALVALSEDRGLSHDRLMEYVAGPDFPTGGQLLNCKAELRRIYELGQGTLRVRAEYRVEERRRGVAIVITSIPYALSKGDVVREIAEVVAQRKLPPLLDVRDESTDDVRLVLEIRRDADPELVMAYLFHHTSLQSSFHVNMTCLVPDGETTKPRRLGLGEMLGHFLDFRVETVTRRLRHRLTWLEGRTHVLGGFVLAFDRLDEIVAAVRRSESRTDSVRRVQSLGLDETQAEAVVELRLYRLARLEIGEVRRELAERAAEASRIRKTLGSERRLWRLVRDELRSVADQLGEPRRTAVAPVGEEVALDESAFVEDEDAQVVVTRDGWIKRAREIRGPDQTRVREGDSVTHVLPGSLRAGVVFLTSRGYAYVIRIGDVAATTGYGDPAQKYFKFADGERIVSAMTLDPRARAASTLMAVSRRGYAARFQMVSGTTTRAGRRYIRLNDGDAVVAVEECSDEDVLTLVTEDGYALSCPCSEIPHLERPGRGAAAIRAEGGVVDFMCSAEGDRFSVETDRGTTVEIAAEQIQGRGGRGRRISRHRLVPRELSARVETLGH